MRMLHRLHICAEGGLDVRGLDVRTRPEAEAMATRFGGRSPGSTCRRPRRSHSGACGAPLLDHRVGDAQQAERKLQSGPLLFKKPGGAATSSAHALQVEDENSGGLHNRQLAGLPLLGMRPIGRKFLKWATFGLDCDQIGSNFASFSNSALRATYCVA
jgi:hypothetical protein